MKSRINFIFDELPNSHMVVSKIVRRGRYSNLNQKISKFSQNLMVMSIDILGQQNTPFEHEETRSSSQSLW